MKCIARDTKLGRDVALKILPPLFTSNADRAARFEREARLLASLNHPHIGAIYGFEDAGSVHEVLGMRQFTALFGGTILATTDQAKPGPIWT